MLRLCGEAEDRLAQELIHFELQVERDVIEPLFVLAEVSGGWGSWAQGVTVLGTHTPNKPGEHRVLLLQRRVWFLAPVSDFSLGAVC